MSYSQGGEDQEVLKLVGPNPGHLLEIGAWDPIHLSNSRLLIEREWSAVLVEFSPASVRALVQAYGYCHRVRVLMAAVSLGDNGCLRRYEITDDALSTGDDAQLEKWKKTGGFYGQLWVPQLSLEHLLLQFKGGYDFVSIDTEGTSVDLAIKFVRELGQRPRVMCVEHDERIVELMTGVQEFGYRIAYTNGNNVILAQ